MSGRKWTSIFFLVLVFLGSEVSHSQSNMAIKRNVAALLFSSLGGAVLGLSTLSFYGEPQEHVNNISLGALIGFSAGLGYVIYSSDATPVTKEFSQQLDPDQRNRRSMMIAKQPAMLQIQFNF